ncbi:MAG: transglutaminase-like domain-containing protein [Chitinophagales bacterium]|nr:transglutaminase-like domain-containing protein [Chitinophagales bacterium]
MEKVLQIFFFLSGANYAILKHCSYRTIVKHACLSLSLIFAVIVSFFAGFEIAAQFTANKAVLIGTGTFWATMVLVFDLILINSGLGDGVTKWLRILVGLSNTFISLTSLLVMLNQSTIDGQITLDSGNVLTEIDNTYLKAKEGRYAAVTKQKEEAETYNTNVVKPEAANGYPGPKYTEKKAAYDAMIQAVNVESSKLDTLEQQYYNAYQTQRNAVASVEAKDFFIKASYMPMVIKKKGWLMVALAIAAALVIGYVELQTVALKLSMKRETEYPEKEKEMEDRRKQSLSAQLEKTTELEGRKIGIKQAVLESGIVQEERDVEMMNFDGAVAYTVELRIKIKGLIAKGYPEEAAVLQRTLERVLANQRESKAKEKGAYGRDEQSDEQPRQTIDSIVQFTESMQPILDTVVATNVPENVPMAIFDWLVSNISYQNDHGKFFYRTSREVWNDGRAICGEMSVLYMSFLRKIGIKTVFVEVTKDVNGEIVSHACVQIDHNDEVFLSDPAYKMYKVEHKEWNVWSDDKLVEQYNLWNEKTF